MLVRPQGLRWPFEDGLIHRRLRIDLRLGIRDSLHLLLHHLLVDPRVQRRYQR
jgi:hypothetical protein